jgi:DNA topoisomerase-1
MNRAVEVLAQKAARGGRAAAAAPLRELGAHPSGGAVSVMNGRYGPYVKWEKVNATLPKDTDPETLTLDEALALVAAKAGAKGKGKAKAAAKPAKAAAKSAKAATKTATKAGKPAAAERKPAASRPAASKAASGTRPAAE